VEALRGALQRDDQRDAASGPPAPGSRSTRRQADHEHHAHDARISEGLSKALYRCSSISIGDPAIRYALRAGRGLEVFDDGELKIHAYVDVGYPATSGTDFYWTMDAISVAVESMQVEHAIEKAVSQIETKTAEALEILAEKSPSPGGR